MIRPTVEAKALSSTTVRAAQFEAFAMTTAGSSRTSSIAAMAVRITPPSVPSGLVPSISARVLVETR